MVATDMVMVNVSFDICEIATIDIEGSAIILEGASFIHETLSLPREHCLWETWRWRFKLMVYVRPGVQRPQGIELWPSRP